MRIFRRIILLILDACGVGELPDAGRYGDTGANTLANTAVKNGGLRLPHLGAMGLGNIIAIKGIDPAKKPAACYGKMAELSAGKDSTVGHWEIAGLISETPFPVFPHGFPAELMARFEQLTGYKTLGNKPASGTQIIAELGQEHCRTGWPIIYTSADSVFQVAAHKKIIPLEELYRICRIAREMLTGPWGVSRVIARPFEGEPNDFRRTAERKDFSIEPPQETMLDRLKAAGYPVIGIGKIEDLFAGRGLTDSRHTTGNLNGIEVTLQTLREIKTGLIFINLVDFDMLWGHRNDYRGFAKGLEQFDQRLPEFLAVLDKGDLLIITADHGCDPTLMTSTDHTREYVPLLVYHISLGQGCDLGLRSTFADIAQTICQNFSLEPFPVGKGFLDELS